MTRENEIAARCEVATNTPLKCSLEQNLARELTHRFMYEYPINNGDRMYRDILDALRHAVGAAEARAEKMRAALAAISEHGYGIEASDDDSYRADYWSNAAMGMRNKARAALAADTDTGAAPSPGTQD